MTTSRKARVIVMAEFDGKLNRVSTFDDVTDININDRYVALYNGLMVVGVVPTKFVLRLEWDDKND